MTRNLSVSNRVSTLALAVALAAGPSPAAAQSFQGSHSAVGANVDQSTPGETNVTVTQEQAVINWTATNNPTDGTIIFQPDGTSATFTGSSNFAVLNRITPGTAGNAIYMGGSITSLINETVGGTVFFYSPNGIIIGQNATINVGSLGLTTLPIADDGEGNWMAGFGTADPTVTFGQATDPASFVRTSAVIDGSINAHGSGSFVALVAPIVQHSGVIRTDTGAALVAAEAATITFSDSGLYSISVTVGTDAATGIDIDGGTIERRNPTEGIGNHTAYLVAVAKNDAVDMLIRNGGSVGFDTATSAAVEDNAVVLSGGGGLFFGSPSVGNGAVPVNLKIDSSTFTSDVYGEVSGGFDIRTSTGNTSFDSGSLANPTNVTLFGSADSIITAINGNTLHVAGTLTANVDEFGTTPLTTGNLLRVSANGSSTLTVGGDAFLSAATYGMDDGEGIDAGDATGGTVILQTGSGSTIDITGSLNMNADGRGGNVGGFDAAGGDGTGGQAHILANGGNGSSITVGSSTNVSATGYGGNPEECSSCQVTGGNGTGGTILLQVLTGTGNQLNLNNVQLTADGEGGAGDVIGGNGLGGNIQLQSGDSGTITIASDLLADADGRGGFGMDNGTNPGVGQAGNGTGGNISTLFIGAASTINLNGEVTRLGADGFGGDGVIGGNATGGWVNLQVGSAGTLNSGDLQASANASGGDSDGLAAAGGSATGGRAWLQVTAGGGADVAELTLDANGSGGESSSAAGGAGTGGHVIASANAGSLTIDGETDLEARGAGGFTDASASVGGVGTGGEAEIIAANGGTVTLAGLAAARADGQGGHYISDGSQGGAGLGGVVLFRANGATLNADSDVGLSAEGTGGFSFGDCNDCGGTGGNGTGGTVNIEAIGGATALLSVDGQMNANAIGTGSSGYAGPGGNGLGGTVRLAVQNGATATFLGDLVLGAFGSGGVQTNGGLAGNGTGGLVDAFIGVTGGTLGVAGFTDLDARGFGGNVFGDGGTGGNGIGGTARYIGLGGMATFGSIVVEATGAGGDSETGTGGNGTGTSARISAVGGDITINGSALVNTSGQGGIGTIGGNGTGGGNFFANVNGAHFFAQNGGDIIINGSATSLADGTGGDGANGGNGGNGTGGWASIHAANGNAGPSTVTVQGVESSGSASASGFGGDGGDGIGGIDGQGGFDGSNGGAGGNGGNGGTGTGGVAALTAAVGNGTLSIGFGFVDASGTGGFGGAGGNGGIGGNADGGTGGNGGGGGNGGAGGAAVGGLGSIGVETGVAAQAPGINGGTANFSFAAVEASALGGDGGAGGLGGAAGSGPPNGTPGADGNGGAGGDAEGGVGELQSRGGTVFVTSALLTANATGGNGGDGVIDGAGGNAESDEVYGLVTNRVGDTSLRGRLSAGTITGVVTSTGGSGSTPGASMMEGGSGFLVINGNARIGSLDFNIVADGQIPDLATDMIEIINSDVRVLNDFTFNTGGVVSVYANNGNLTAGTFTVSASNFIHDPDRLPPTIVGTISADTFNLVTSQDLVIDAHLISTGQLDLVAPGLIDIEDATSGGALSLNAGSTITGGSMTADGTIDAFAPGDITLGLVNAGSDINITSLDGSLSLSHLSSPTFIDLEAGGGIGFGDVTADDLDFDAGGDVNGGDIIAGTFAGGEAGGAVSLGSINVGILQAGGPSEDGFAVGIAAEGSISVGDVDADEAIGFATLGNLTTGNLSAGTDVLTLVGGDTNILSITTPGGGRTYHGDAQMFLDAGGPDDFDPSLVFAQAPVQSGGSYTVVGAISTGTLQVGAAAIATGNIDASNGVSLDSATSVTTGTIDTDLLQITAGTDITTGDIFAFDGVGMDAGGSITTGDIDAGSIDLFAGADITTGYLNTQLLLLQEGIGKQFLFPGASITVESGGDISTGNISSIDGVYLLAAGSILTGNIDAFTFVEGHAGTSLTTDDIDAGDYILLTADSGAIAIGDAVAANAFQAVAGTNLSAGDVSASDINATAGGTATVDGTWSAGDVQITSDDIDIGADGAIFAGDISLVSTNATRTIVGDGIDLAGYELSDAEYDRLHSNDITVIADAGLGAAPLMLIGDLTVDGSDGEAIHDYEFITGDSESETALGSIRIVGDMVFSNMGTVQSVGFTTGTFELDAATGLLSLEGAPGVLGGELFLNAAHIHVASADILDQLAEDPQYDGYQEDLNAPAEVQRPDGVIRAASIDIEFGNAGTGELNTLYVQNTGTSDLPAGFVIGGESLFGEGNEVTPPPGSIDLIINGQIVTQGGTLTGIDVRDALVEAEGDITPFTDNSTINGCLLTGPCEGVEPPEPPFPPGFIPTPGIQDEVDLIDDGLLPPPLFGNEDFIDDNSDFTEDGATSPIEPPVPLFDTSALGDPGDIDDPVSGSGNPGLMESPPGQAACQSEAAQAAGQCKETQQ